jgi:hypothetical protein
MDRYLNQEQPSPPRLPQHATHMQQAKGEKTGQDICNRHGCPEETQSDRQFVVFVKVREIQNDLSRSVTFPKKTKVSELTNIRNKAALQNS